jgi:signal transduction histidine kinase
MTTPETILLVDDEDALRWNMRAFLEDLGFQVLEARRGQEALALCREHRPHLILLDISMPEMNGFEVCRQLKTDPRTAEIPVIFVSAFLRVTDKVNAFASGGVDYVTKPFHFEEVEARIRAHLELHRQRRELKAQHAALLRLEQERDGFIHMLAHDMRGPLTAILGCVDLARLTAPPENASLATYLNRATEGAERITSMINQMLELSRLESGNLPLNRSQCDLVRLVQESVAPMQAGVGKRRLVISGLESLFAYCDADVFGRILGNLVGNAFKFTPQDGRVEIQVTRSGDSARVAVIDDGPGLPVELQQSVFEKFTQAKGAGSKQGFGMGLAFCKLAVEAHQGQIGVESEPGHGSTFWFTLPLVPPTDSGAVPEPTP